VRKDVLGMFLKVDNVVPNRCARGAVHGSPSL